ncbi:hypothetical protein [Acetobacter persici]|uniref:hypothetical protein n=1 Tax=Acetobacter persici TaxID=1076596 RepID=UPI0005BB1F84|nr:hypothetical protein [Acetobacter persici]MCG0998949.1 hypothetical protein [Acetobacter persici]
MKMKFLARKFRAFLLAGVPVFCGISVAHAAGTEWAPIPLSRTMANAAHDPSGIWSDDDMAGNGDIWRAEMTLHNPERKVEIEQLVNGNCGSPSTCPVKVIEHEGAQSKTLLDGDELCAAGASFMIDRNLTAIKACGQTLKLGQHK